MTTNAPALSSRAPSMQVGIFSNDLCISFRIVLHEILDAFVFRILDDAKTLSAETNDQNIKNMYERGIKSVNTWDTNLKDRYRAQIVAQYRQIAQLYRHIFLMYVEEMYNQSLGDVTVRVNIPSLSNMLYTFLKLCCNNPAIYRGEYVTSMAFMGRVLFVETIIRRTLYELLVQQNNIKGISIKKEPGKKPVAEEKEPPLSPPSPQQKKRPGSANVTVYSEEDVHSHELAMGQPHQVPTTSRSPSQVMTMQNLSDRLSQGAAPPAAVSVTAASVPMPSLHSSSLQAPAFSNQTAPSFKFFDDLPTQKTTTVASSVVSIPKSNPPAIASSVVSIPKSNPPAISAASPAQLVKSTVPSVKSASPINLAAASTTAPPPATSLPGITSPITLPLTPPALRPTPAVSMPAALPTATTAAGNIFSIASQQTTKTAASDKEPIFELASQFTAHKPGGETMPDPKPLPSPAGQNNDSAVDSLQLLPSDQDYAAEVKRLLDTATTNSITPFDSVTNIANGGGGGANRPPPGGGARKSLFFPPVP